ncbi:MAG: tRNA pseudouridine(38-40) synthase TruA [Bdellovibrionales bacterium]
MRKIRLLLSYDGTDYQGWQKQPGLVTVQGTVETVLTQIYNEPIRVVASGRTDAGAHAVGQVVHFEAPKVLVGEDKLVRRLNALLPDSAVAKGAWLAPENFHALASARRKTYVYRIWNHPIRSALWRHRALWVPYPLDLRLLNRLATDIRGQKDFKSFQTQGTPVKSTIRQVDHCSWRQVGSYLVEMRIRGNGFLKQMVRNIVGTKLYLARHGGGRQHLRDILDAKDRQAAKATAAPYGLYLYRVEYPWDLDNKCRKL